MALVTLKAKRKGKGVGIREFQYQGFRLKDVVKTPAVVDDKGVETTPAVIDRAEVPSLKEVLDALGGDEKKLTLAAAIGANKIFADAASDQFYGLIPDTFNDEQRKSLRTAAREIMKALKKSPAEAVKMILA